MRLEGKVVLITGAGSGLGRAGARLFAEEGAQVVATDVVGWRAKETAELIRADGGAADSCLLDVTDEAQAEAAIAHTVKTFGRLDVVWNNAGIGDPGHGTIPYNEMPLENWNKVFAVNVTGPALVSKHAVGPMTDVGGGSIVMTSSVASGYTMRGFPAYCASKAALNGLVRSLAMELGHLNIRVNAICPMQGMSVNFWLPSDTSVAEVSIHRLTAEYHGGWVPENSTLPLKAPRPPDFRDNAYAALYLASDEAAYISGVTFPTADGGLVAGSPLQATGVYDFAQELGRKYLNLQ